MIVWALCLALTCLTTLTPGQTADSGLEGVPAAALARLPAEARLQVTEQEVEVRVLLASGDDDRALAESVGELGRLLYAYGLSGSARNAWVLAVETMPGDYRWHYYLGVLDRVEGALESALERFARVLEQRPEDLAARLRMGEIELERGQLMAAAATFNEALERQPGSAVALAGLGRLALAEQRYQEAIDLLERALTSQRDGSVIHHPLGLAYRGLGDLEQARLHLARNRGVPVSMSDPLMEQLAGEVRGAHFYARVGIQSLKAGDPSVAVEALERAVGLDSENAWIRYNLAVAQRELGLVETSRAQLLAVLELDPDYRNAHYNLGTLMAAEEDYTGAVQHFRRAREIDPLDYDAWLELAVALSRSGQAELALMELEGLVETAPQFAEARLALATLLAQRGRFEAALATTKELLMGDATESERADAHRLAGRLLESGQPAEAEAHYRAVLELLGEAEYERHRLALMLGRLGRFADAGMEFQRLIDAHPGNAQYWMGQAMALLLGESYPTARRTLQAAVERFPTDMNLAHSLALLLATCPDDTIRDGVRALEIVGRVFDAEPSVDHAETMAMALAEVGEFERAMELQKQVVEQRRLTDSGPRLEVSRGYLDQYSQGKAIRAPWIGGR